MVIGAILQASSYGLAQFIIGRIVTGIGNGLNTSTVPTWQSERATVSRIIVGGMLWLRALW